MLDSIVQLFHEVFVCGLVAFGGMSTILAGLHTNLVTRLGLVSEDEFGGSFALAAAAPGPNCVFLGLLGYQVAGVAGMLAAVLAWSMATLPLLLIVGRVGSLPCLKEAKRALLPCVLGMLAAGCFATVSGYSSLVPQGLLTLVVLRLLCKYPNVNPALFVLGAGVVGALFLR